MYYYFTKLPKLSNPFQTFMDIVVPNTFGLATASTATERSGSFCRGVVAAIDLSIFLASSVPCMQQHRL